MSQRNNDDTTGTEVVVGVDGSPASRAALRWAVAQARRMRARVHAVTAWEIPAYAAWGVIPYDDLAATAEKQLRRAIQETLGEEDRDVTVLETVAAGHPAQVLIDASDRAALLVVGSRGHGGFAGTLLGSVSQQCTQHAHCPVVVVRGKC